MKYKIVIGVLMVLISFSGISVLAVQYPVKPVDNGLAKKVIEWIFTDEGLKKNTTIEARIEAANL